MKYKSLLFALVIIGGLSFLFYLNLSPTSAWATFLISNFYFTSIALFGAFFLSVHYLTRAKWWLAIKSVLLSLTNYIYIGAILSFIIYFFGFSHLYEWSYSDFFIDHPELSDKKFYLDNGFFLIRMVVIYFVFILLTRKLTKHSLEFTNKGEISELSQIKKYSVFFLISFAIGFSIKSFDDIMTLEPAWYSTIFALYVFAGLFISAISFIIIAILLLKKSGYLEDVKEEHFFLLGRYLFAFSTFWAYIWVSQYLMIWYANIPEETIYYAKRMNASWIFFSILNLFLNWVIPFILLISHNAKKNSRILAGSAIVVLIGHFLDLYLMVMPIFSEEFCMTFFEPLIFIGFFALFVLLFVNKFKKIGGTKWV